MKKLLVVLALVLLLVCACALADGITVTDMMGREITFDAPVDTPVVLTAYDLQGRQQLRLTIPSGTSVYTLPGGSLPRGVYALQLGRMGSWLVRL